MPCMGPSYSQEKADEAYAEIVKLLADKFNVLRFPLDLEFERIWVKHREKALDALKAAVHGMFEQNCFEGF